MTEEQLSRVLDPDEKYFKSISEKLTYEISNSVCNLAEIPELIIQESGRYIYIYNNELHLGEENYLELPTNNSTPRIQELIQDKEQLENKNQALELKILELNQKLEKQADDLTKKLTAQMDVVKYIYIITMAKYICVGIYIYLYIAKRAKCLREKQFSSQNVYHKK